VSDDPKPVKVEGPAVHTDALWDNPGVLDNVTAEPIDSTDMTKREYFALLSKHGLRMKDQQESTTGPEQAPLPVEIPLQFQPTPPPEPFTKDEARLFGAMTAFFKQYGIVEALYCNRCFTRKRHHGCHVVVSDQQVSVMCRCGTALYKPPTGTTDLVIRKFTTTDMTLNDRTRSLISTPIGPEMRPATILSNLEAALLQEYFAMISRRDYEPHWYHRGCWTSGRLIEEEQVAVKVSPYEVVILCECQTLYCKIRTQLH
jgi:hypothetical protein